YKIRPEERTLPSDEEVASRRDGERLGRLIRELGAVPPAEEWLSLARRLWMGDGGEALVAQLLQRHFAESSVATPVPQPTPPTERSSVSEPPPPQAVAKALPTEVTTRIDGGRQEPSDRPKRGRRRRGERGKVR